MQQIHPSKSLVSFPKMRILLEIFELRETRASFAPDLLLLQYGFHLKSKDQFNASCVCKCHLLRYSITPIQKCPTTQLEKVTWTLFQVSLSFHSSMSQFGTYTLSSRFPSVFTFIKKKKKKKVPNVSGIIIPAQESNGSEVRLILAATLWKWKASLRFSGRKILESSIKCSVKPQGFFFFF